MSLNLKSLIAKLDPACRTALEGAASLCISRTNYEIEVEHFLSQLVEPVREQEEVGLFDAHFDCEVCMNAKHIVVAVYGDEELGVNLSMNPSCFTGMTMT